MTDSKMDLENSLGVSMRGNPKDGQSVTLRQTNSLKKLFGTVHDELADGLFHHCVKVLRADEASDEYPGNDERMFMMAAIAEIKPRDGVERMLAVQMAATHVAMVRAGRWMAKSDNLKQVEAHSNGFNKLARTYTSQMEALRKHRNGGKQTVTVQHVNVEGGGQAIVGNVQTGEGSA